MTEEITIGRIKNVATEIWSAALAFGGAIGGALIAVIGAKALRKEDVVASNLKTQLDFWRSLVGELNIQVDYRDKQIGQYTIIIEVLRNERTRDRARIDECERGRTTLYYELNELRRVLKLPEIPVPPIESPDSLIDLDDDNTNKSTC